MTLPHLILCFYQMITNLNQSSAVNQHARLCADGKNGPIFIIYRTVLLFLCIFLGGVYSCCVLYLIGIHHNVLRITKPSLLNRCDVWNLHHYWKYLSEITQHYKSAFATGLLRSFGIVMSTIPVVNEFHEFPSDKVRILVTMLFSWVSYQTSEITGCACAGNAGKVFPVTQG